MATEEFIYRGYTIPKDTLIIGNIWSISHDPTLFPSPSSFLPTRWLTPSGTLRENLPDLRDNTVSFGFGRRICPGRDFANNTMWIDMTYLLWAFEFERAKDADGKEIVPGEMELEDHGLAIHPAPFPCVLKPRRGELMDLLAQH